MGTKLFSNHNLFKLFLPIVIEQFLEYLVGLADSIMAAYVGEAAVSGVSLIDFVMALIISLFAALSTGGAVVAGQYLGSQKKSEARSSVNQLVWFAGILSVIIMGLVYLLKPFILHDVFGPITPDVYTNAERYLMITALSIPFLALYNAGAAIFRTTGNAKLPMLIMLAMNIAHVVGNAVLIYGFHFGVEGVAIPTLLARIIAAVLILSFAMDNRQSLYITRTLKYKCNLKLIKQILNIGIPYGLENALFYFGRIIVLSLVATFGTASIAANAVGGTIVMFEALPGMAIGFGLTVVIARCLGAGDYEQAHYYTKKIIGIVYIAQFVSCFIVIMLLPIIMDIYALSSTATAMTYKIVWTHAIMEVLIWPLACTLPVTFRAAGDTRFPMIIGTLSMIFIRIALSYVFGIYLDMGMFGTWLAVYIDLLIKAVIFFIRYLRGTWMRYHVI